MKSKSKRERLSKIQVKLNFIIQPSTGTRSRSASASASASKEEEEEIIKLNRSDWNIINQFNHHQPPIDRTLISIQSTLTFQEETFKPLIVYAQVDSNLPCHSSSTTSKLIYNHFSRPSSNHLQIQFSPILNLINLNQVYLQSFNLNSYQYAQSNPHQFRLQLSSRIIRQSHQIHLSNTYSYKIILTDPVIQGAFDLHSTSLTLLSPSQSDQNQLSNQSNKEEEEDEEDDQIDIEPDFLAQSALRQPLALDSSLLTNLNTPLSLKPIPNHNHLSSDLLQAFVRTTTLAKLGVCKDDWVLLHSTSDQTLNQPIRLIKLSLSLNPISSDEILISPIFLNQLQSSTYKISPARLHLNLPPRFPILKSLTLARVASPQVGLKQLQPLFLTALSDHFKSQSRILKLHDLVAVPIDSRLSRFLPSNPIGPTNDESSVDTDLLEMDLDLGPPQTLYNPTHEVQKHQNGIGSNDGSSHEIEEDPEMSESLENANLGAILDPNLTKLVQTGLEQSFVPNMIPSLGIHGLPPLDPLDLDHEPTKKLYEILRASSQPDATSYELPCTILINGQRGVGETNFSETEVKTAGLLETWIERVTSSGPCVLFLRQLEGLARKLQTIENGGREPSIVRILNEALESLKEKKGKYPVILIGSTSELPKISIGLLNLFKLKIQMDSPNEIERIRILKRLTQRDLISIDVNFELLGRETSSLVAKDLVTLVSMTRYIGMKRTLKGYHQRRSKDQTLRLLESSRIQLRLEDFQTALNQTRKGYFDRIGAPKIPNVKWEDIGGLKEVKESILETLTLPINRPELFSNGLKKRSGILLFGPPGTGKTMIAKAVATSVGMNFMSVKGPELLDQYIGESEAKVRRVFERARESAPTVIFFDELDSLAPRRGNQGDSGGVMDRIVSQLLAELDSMSIGSEDEKKKSNESPIKSKGGEVFVIGATNRPDLLDPALLRPGRFEKLVYLGGIESDVKRLEVMKALTRKMKLDEKVRLEKVIERLRDMSLKNGEGMIVTGADLYSICSDGMMRSMRRITREIEMKKRLRSDEKEEEKKEEEEEEVKEILIKQEDLIEAVEDWKGSVSENEMKHYKAAQLKFTKEGNLLGVEKKVKSEGVEGREEEGLKHEGFGDQTELNGEENEERKGKGKWKGKGKGKGKGKEKMI
ncbi:hypothetical protein DFH28DRAFT_1123296 [Melampsora americana]|nr:hypothetical protein DFH28DRAFT_1123296 [Melampsora americana]